MAISIINRFVSLFDTADTPRLAMLVHPAMEPIQRGFRKLGHFFGLCEYMQPRKLMAALFHSLAHDQLDEGMQDALALAKEMFDCLRMPLAFLQVQNRFMVCATGRGYAQIALLRRDGLQAFAQRL